MMQEIDSGTPGALDVSEAKFLERQAADANAAIMETIRELFDPRQHIRQHPWWSVGVAGLAGIATGKMLHHSGSHSSKEEGADIATHKRSALPPMILKTIISEGLKFLIPTLFTGAVLAKTQEQIDQAADGSSNEQ
jgi:hypothetical protein